MAGIQNNIEFAGGFKLQVSSSRDISDMQMLSTDVSDINHTGNPEGVISANPSSLCHDPVSGDVYVKASGTGTTGWALLSQSISITGDTGAILTPFDYNIFGQKAGTVQVVETTDSGSTLSIEDRTWFTQYVVDPSSTLGLRGTFTTIQSAITAATAPANIFIRPGVYTENLTLKVGVNLCAFEVDGFNPTVTILGTCTHTTAGIVCLSGIRLETNSSFALAITGSAASVINATSCYINCTNNDGISLTSSSASSGVNLWDCYTNLGNTGIGICFITGNGTLFIRGGRHFNTGGSTSPSGCQSGIVALEYADFFYPWVTTSTGKFGATYCNIDTSTQNNAALSLSGSNSQVIDFCRLASGTQVALVAPLSSCSIYNSIIASSNVNAITSTGLTYGNLTFEGTSNYIFDLLSVPKVTSNDAINVITPASYPYTTLPQDALILVDTSVARTIVPSAFVTTGLKYIIKDNVGTAATNNITITPSGKNIEGAASLILSVNWASATIVYNGTQWIVI